MDNKSVVLNWVKATDSGDFATIEKLYGAKHKFYMPMSPVPLDTKQHIGMMQGFHASFSELRHDVLDIFESGNKVVLRGIYNGKQTGDFNGLPASGKTVKSHFISIYEIENGEIINQWLEFDLSTFMAQLSAAPVAQEAH